LELCLVTSIVHICRAQVINSQYSVDQYAIHYLKYAVNAPDTTQGTSVKGILKNL